MERLRSPSSLGPQAPLRTTRFMVIKYLLLGILILNFIWSIYVTIVDDDLVDDMVAGRIQPTLTESEASSVRSILIGLTFVYFLLLALGIFGVLRENYRLVLGFSIT